MERQDIVVERRKRKNLFTGRTYYKDVSVLAAGSLVDLPAEELEKMVKKPLRADPMTHAAHIVRGEEEKEK